MNNICLMIDIDGFTISRKFYARELGYASLTGDDYGSFRFDLTHVYPSEKDMKCVTYCKKMVHGLSLYPEANETNLYPEESIEDLIKELYYKNKINVKSFIGYKGGTIEKQILSKLELPHINIEIFGCPKYNELPPPNIKDCGFHLNIKTVHCPMKECFAFANWVNVMLSLSRICLVFTIYGFKIQQKFYPREFAYTFIDDMHSCCYRFDIGHVTDSMNNNDWKNVLYTKHNINGLSLRPYPEEENMLLEMEFEDLIKSIYYGYKQEDKPLVGVYGHESKILDRLNIPNINISCLTYKLNISDNSRNCGFHLEKPSIHCAEEKCLATANVIKEKLQIQNIM